MDKLIGIIERNREKHPDLVYYLRLANIVKEEKYNNPDIAIETCKALFEGISKTVLIDLGENRRQTNNITDVGFLFKNADKKLSEKISFDLQARHDETGNSKKFVSLFINMIEKGDDLEDLNWSHEYAEKIAKIRHKRGDISHGRSVPKTENSQAEFAQLVIDITDIILPYFLKYFLQIAKPYDVETVEYDDNEDFNIYLDEINPTPDNWGNIVYSKSLYEQAYEDYLMQLEEYKNPQE